MNKGNDAVEKVLAGLRGVEVPPGLEGRVLKGVRAHVERRSRSSWRQWRRLGPALVCGLGLMAAGIFGWLPRPESGRTLPRLGVVGALPAADSQRAVTRVMPARLEAVTRPVRRRVKRGRSEDLVALDETRAPSLSAPPLPMTEEERMLLRIVHRGDPEELALLSPEMRLQQDAEGNAEFQRFFRPARAKADQKP